MKKKYNLLCLIILIACFLAIPVKADTESLSELMGGRVDQVRGEAGVGEAPSVGATIAFAVRGVLSLLATIFLILVIVAGYRWMTAQGNEETITKAKQTLKEAIIGLAIVLAAYGITYFIFDVLPFGGLGDAHPPIS